MRSEAPKLARLLLAGAICLVPFVFAQSSAIVTFVSGPNFCTTAPAYITYPFCTAPGEIPLGSFAVPSAGGSFVDPNFGGTVRVMTGSPYIHPYSLPSPVSAHNKYIHVLQRDTFRSSMLDLATGAVAYDGLPFANAAHVWDATNDDAYYLILGAKIIRHTLSSNTDSVVADYSNRFTSINSGGSSETSKDNWMSFWAESEHTVCAVDLNTAKTYCADYQAANPGNRMGWGFIDYSMITKGVDSVTGKRYVFLMSSPALGAYSVNLSTGNLDFEYRGPELQDISHGNHDGVCDPGEPCLGGPHADLMEDSDGKQYMVTPKGNEEPCELDLVTYSLSKGIRLTDLESAGGGRHRVMNLANCGTNWPSYHIGCAKNAPYCVISIYSDTLRSPADRTTPFDQDPHRGQMMVMRGNGLELRFLAMTRTVLFTDDSYWPQARAAISNDGSWVVFDSNYGIDNGERVNLMPTGFGSSVSPPPVTPPPVTPPPVSPPPVTPPPVTPPAVSTGVWNSMAINPQQPWYPDSSPVTLGMKFRSDVAGAVSGVRFYNGSPQNNGTHIGLLYSASGALLAQAAFSAGNTPGWQTATFSSPVAIDANTTYVAAYFTTSGYAASRFFFSSNGVDNAPLHALSSSAASGNGVYQYAASPQFPASSYQDSNYWVDAVFTAGAGGTPPSQTTVSLYTGDATPGDPWYPDSNPVTLGMKFRSDVAGTVTGMRFWKGAGNNGTHIALLYSASGQLLAQAPFAAETPSGWQTVTFSSPVPIAANTTYIAAWFTTSGYAASRNFFTSQGITNGPLHALQSGVDGANMVYQYAGTPQFPTSTWQDSNYWVDVLVSINK